MNHQTTLGEIGNNTEAARELQQAVREAGRVNQPRKSAEVVDLNDYRRPVTVRVKLWDEM